MLPLLMMASLGCAGSGSVVTEETYQERVFRGGVLAVQPFTVSLGTTDTDVFLEMAAVLEDTVDISGAADAVALLLRESMSNRWYSYT
ncbi:MAG: hypothetical protein AAFQ17_07930, partial [Pseudomonadota bacterium]